MQYHIILMLCNDTQVSNYLNNIEEYDTFVNEYGELISAVSFTHPGVEPFIGPIDVVRERMQLVLDVEKSGYANADVAKPFQKKLSYGGMMV